MAFEIRTVESIFLFRTFGACAAKIDLLLCSSYRSMGDSVPMSIINSISNFRVLFSSSVVETELVKRYGRKIDEILDLLKMVIDGVLTQITPDDKLLHVLEELDRTINEALKLVESWDWMMSKIYFVTSLSLSFTTLLDMIHNS
jgi:hypothetical protein